MKIFVAADWKHRLQAAEVMRWLQRRGHHITCDWTQETAKDPAILTGIAERDARGLLAAEVLLVVMNGRGPYRGVWFEIGMALALGKAVVTLGRHRYDCVYGYHPALLQAKTLREAEALLELWADRPRRLLPPTGCRECERRGGV